ncbi:MAG: hypothetical protein ACRDVG_16805, partial [Jatrophihabitantaceae bacterium]
DVMSIIVYGDFSGPECYLASRRADALAAAATSIDWRAIECRPRLPVTGCRLSAAEQDALAARFRAIDHLLLPGEELPWTMPGLAPKSEAAVSGYAEAYGSAVDADVRRLLFELYWLEGADIGSPTVLRTPLAGPMLRSDASADPLRQVGYAVSVARGPITSDAYWRIRGWRAEWQALDRPALPVVMADGATLTGVDALRRLGKEIAYVDADVDPRLGDPRRYPAVAGKPSPAWVSQIGGRWRNIYRLEPAR